VEAKPIEKSELRVHSMPKHDVTKLVSQEGSQAGLVRRHIQQTAAQHDGVAHGIGFKSGGHKYAAADLRLDVKAIGDQKVADHQLESLVDLAVGGHQTKFLQSCDNVILRLASPQAVCLQRRVVGGAFCLILRWPFHEDSSQLLLLLDITLGVAPQSRL